MLERLLIESLSFASLFNIPLRTASPFAPIAPYFERRWRKATLYPFEVNEAVLTAAGTESVVVIVRSTKRELASIAASVSAVWYSDPATMLNAFATSRAASNKSLSVIGRENSHEHCNELISPPFLIKSITGLLSIEPEGDKLKEEADPEIAEDAADSSSLEFSSDSSDSS